MTGAYTGQTQTSGAANGKMSALPQQSVAMATVVPQQQQQQSVVYGGQKPIVQRNQSQPLQLIGQLGKILTCSWRMKILL